MSDFKLLKCLQSELLATLNKRIEYNNKNKGERFFTYPATISKARINRLRLEIQACMLRISNKLSTFYDSERNNDDWY